ncbi:hypothetical protein BLA60_37940 [Actinophytocola xinjiangensis]|uniref:Uncharacterized protein n=2 Tax=Actinophytocola xinjiangensis TaxID=485602 RepID=A0A7Z0WEE4_9PSEU|nr:hypothetical protein BLA60_37940 [Actinophytocola xinjiangensis]
MVTVVAALVSMVMGTAPAAATAGWTVTPGGSATASSGEAILTFRSGAGGDDLAMPCASTTIELNFFSSSDSHIADITGIGFNQCVASGLLTFEFDAHTPWAMHALSYSPPMVYGEVRDVAFTIIGPGCLATVQGTLNFTYNNVTGELIFLPDFTLSVTNVDPIDNCLGLINTGDSMSIEAAFSVSPVQHIVPA